ncbi:GNAT family N-acetyltransferase [Anthocerotibacter panamensis]|uniref:GNAT family N-acetyltransferase n=1 Tax=Anthocerotibacter panamensis TaxID=2857077 RepID=UPI001C403D00|nr:GNAT family N-acetyltransferase [Anthocerotibacter panamensis]
MQRITRATAQDAHVLCEVAKRSFFEAFGAQSRPEDMAAYLAAAFSPKQQAMELADPCITVFLATLDAATVGYAMLHDHACPACITGPKPIELARLYVLQEWIGCGVGKALMQTCLEQATQAGYTTLWLGVWEHNLRARAFYRRWDFSEVGQHGFLLGSDLQKDLLMERRLPVTGTNTLSATRL